MHNGVKIIFAFALGAVAGAAASWRLLKTKYEQIAQEEIESVKETYAELFDGNDEEPSDDCVKPENAEPKPKSDIMAKGFPLTDKTVYLEKVHDYSGKEESEEVGTAPFEIQVDEYGSIYEHDCIELTLFADGVLVDDGYMPVDNVDEIVGNVNICKLKDSDEDTIWVRDLVRKADYEIVKDVRNFADLDLSDEV